MRASKVYWCDLRTHGRTSRLEKLEHLLRAAGLADMIDIPKPRPVR